MGSITLNIVLRPSTCSEKWIECYKLGFGFLWIGQLLNFFEMQMALMDIFEFYLFNLWTVRNRWKEINLDIHSYHILFIPISWKIWQISFSFEQSTLISEFFAIYTFIVSDTRLSVNEFIEFFLGHIVCSAESGRFDWPCFQKWFDQQFFVWAITHLL